MCDLEVSLARLTSTAFENIEHIYSCCQKYDLEIEFQNAVVSMRLVVVWISCSHAVGIELGSDVRN